MQQEFFERFFQLEKIFSLMHIVFAFITIIPHHIPHFSRESEQDYQLNSASLHGDEVKLCTANCSIADEIHGYEPGSVEAQKSC